MSQTAIACVFLRRADTEAEFDDHFLWTEFARLASCNSQLVHELQWNSPQMYLSLKDTSTVDTMLLYQPSFELDATSV